MENTAFIVTTDLLASKGQRFLNFCIDLLIIYVIGICIVATINIVGDLTNSYGASNWVRELTPIENCFFGLILLLFYYGVTEMYFARTFAKYYTKTLVVKQDGSKPNRKSIIIRTISRLIPLEPLTFLTPNSRGWHDILSVTYVVKKKSLSKK